MGVFVELEDVAGNLVNGLSNLTKFRIGRKI